MMHIHEASFIKSSVKLNQCPEAKLPEFAFVGRSNVGKSSLINMLLSRKNLAKTSQNPGKTQHINHFIINDSWYLADLPGYGYAKASKKKRAFFHKLITDYAKKRNNLYCLFVLIDSRLEPQQNDLDFIEWCGINQVPFVLIFTKSDKLSSNKLKSNMNHYKEVLLQQWEELPPLFITSATKQNGRDEVLEYIQMLIQKNPFEPPE